MTQVQKDTSYYELLEVPNTASREEIEESYHRIIDFMGPQSLAMYAMLDDEEAERLRASIDDAYRTLTDPERRAAYDRGSSYPSVMMDERAGAEVSTTAPRREPLPPVQLPAPEPPAAVLEVRPPAPVLAVRPPAPPPAPEPAARLPAPDPRTAPVRPRPVPATPPPSRRRRLEIGASVDVGPDTEFSGALLRRLRESADASLEEVSELTKISKRYLTALEENDFDTLPAFVYVRGFVCEYARALGLDTKLVASSYMALYRRYRGEGI